MRIAPALSRLVAPIIAVGVLVGGCGQIFPATTASPGAAAVTGLSVRNAQSAVPGSLRPGTVYRNPANGRNEMVVADISRTAVLIGDSQSEPTSSWPRRALASLGYEVHFCGRGGTGFVASNGATGNYIDALQHGDWLLPYGSPPLVVIEGGGNDASRGASDAQISANAERLIASIRQRYPEARLAMVGTLARGAANGGGRRSEVNTLLGTVAARNSIPFVGVGDWLTRYNLTNSMADGVHMNPAGHTALGLLLAGRLDDLGFRSAGSVSAGSGQAGNGQAGSGQAGSVSAGSGQAESGSTESAAGR